MDKGALIDAPFVFFNLQKMEQEIIYKGVSSAPDEYRCEDGQLSVCEGMRNDDGSWRLAVPSLRIGTLADGEEVMYVHETQDGGRNYIVKTGDGLVWRKTIADSGGTSLTARNVTGVTAVGNVLCCATDDGLVYAMWREGTYVAVESPLWRPKAQFCMEGKWLVQEDDGIIWAKMVNTDRDADGDLIGMKAMTVRMSGTETASLDVTGLSIAANSVWGYKIEGVGDRASSYNLDVSYTITAYYEDGTTKVVTPAVSWKNTDSTKYAYVTAEKKITRMTAAVTVKNNDARNSVNVAVMLCDFGEGGWLRLGTDGVDAVKARVNTYRKNAEKNKKLLDPFFAQVGVRMYDGNIVAVGPPCLLVPCTDVQPFVMPLHGLGSLNDSSGPDYYTKDVDGVHYRGFKSVTAAMECTLRVRILNVSDADKTLYQSIVIAVSEPVRLCDASKTDGYSHRKLTADDGGLSYLRNGKRDVYDYVSGIVKSDGRTFNYIVSQPRRDDVEDALLRASAALYVVQEIPIEDAPAQGVWTDVDMTDVDMSALSAGEKMPTDGSYMESFCGGDVYAYNSRLHIGGYSERLFGGYGVHEMSGAVSIVGGTAVASVELTEDDTACKVVSSEAGLESAKNWFFYPRIGGSRAVVRSRYVYELPLKKHPYRSGCYWFSGFDTFPEDSGAIAASGSDTIEKKNYVRVSNVNNPFVMSSTASFSFRSEVVKIASAVTALSTGQMGQFGLYVLTSGDGVWSLKMSDDGKYLRQVPVTRDAIVGDGRSLCQVDGSVVFATDMGVMELSGSKSTCLSNDIAESTSSMARLRDYLQSCRIVYDYAGQRLMVGNEAYSYVYVRSLRTGLWSMETMTLRYALNSYPDAIVAVAEASGDAVIVLTSADEVGVEDGDVRIVTRALKLGDNNRFKRVTHVRQNGIIEDDGSVRQVLYASNDLKAWYQVASAAGMRLTVAAGGSGFRFFKVSVEAKMCATDFLSSMTIAFAYVDNDKLM